MSIALTKTLLLLPKAQEPDTEINTVTTVTDIIWGFIDAREVKDYFFCNVLEIFDRSHDAKSASLTDSLTHMCRTSFVFHLFYSCCS